MSSPGRPPSTQFSHRSAVGGCNRDSHELACSVDCEPRCWSCGAIEAEISNLPEAEQKAFLEDLGLKESGLDRMAHAGYKLLNLSTYFTAGEKEVRAWTIPANARAPQAAGVIHSAFEKGFIRAEVYHFEDLMKYKSEQAVKEAGLLRLEGKEYVVRDGDIMHFRFNV